MKTDLQKYPAYKDSGVEWLGDIPSHWNTLSNKNIFKLKKNQVGKKSGDYVLLSLTLNGVIKRDMENPQGKFPAEFNTYQEVKKGDFIFCLFDVEETPRCVGLSDFDGMITGAYTVMEPYEGFDRNFLYYFYLNLDADKRLKPLYTGLRNTISKENFFSFKAFVPPLREQTAIATFLNRKTALIDQAIDIKQKQIELLKERRQILIHKAVTRGLDPNVKMKDSGVEWIGEIPEGWEVSRLKNHVEMITGYPFKSEKYTEVGIKLARGINVKEGVFNWDETRFWPVVEKHLEKYLLKEGDVLIAMDGSKVGKNFCKVKEEDLPILLLQRVARLRPTAMLCSSFLFNNIVNRNFLLWVEKTKTDPMVPHIAPSDIYNFQITIPPLEEQNSISEFIEISSSKILTAISLKEQEIEKLKEYKATLINSAVTGKIMVNG
jgi:type I restriction enzyme S subunit